MASETPLSPKAYEDTPQSHCLRAERGQRSWVPSSWSALTSPLQISGAWRGKRALLPQCPTSCRLPRDHIEALVLQSFNIFLFPSYVFPDYFLPPVPAGDMLRAHTLIFKSAGQHNIEDKPAAPSILYQEGYLTSLRRFLHLLNEDSKGSCEGCCEG